MMLPSSRHTVLLRASHSFRWKRTAPRTLARLLSSLAILEQRDGKLETGSLGTITAASKLGGSITGFLAGSGVKSVAEQAAAVKNLEKVVFVENGAYDKVRRPLGLGGACLMATGPPRELWSIVGGEHSTGRIHSCVCESLGIRKEHHAPGRSAARLSADVRHHRHRGRRQYGWLLISIWRRAE